MRFLMSSMVNGGFRWLRGGDVPVPPVCNPLTTLQDHNNEFIFDENGLCIQE